MQRIFIAVSLSLNLILTAIVTYTYVTIPFDMDTVRANYLEDMKWAYTKGCTTGVDYPPEYKQNGPGWNDHSPVSWCYDKNVELSDIYMQYMWKLGRRRK